jgi:outer membrane protein OmpA-like peptidoglycan-associated protein
MVKSLPIPEMEKLMLTHIEAGEEELRQLAARRANAVRDALLKSGKIEAERLFIVEPKGLTPEPKEKVKESRVEFKIA